MTRRFRLDSATSVEIERLRYRAWVRAMANRPVERANRGQRLLGHWWALGHDPARALRCPECHGSGMALLVQERSPYSYAGDARCSSCSGRGWSMLHERMSW